MAIDLVGRIRRSGRIRPRPSKWAHQIGGSGWGNRELQYYTDATDNAATDGLGNLVIAARRDDGAGRECWYGRCQYTSARLRTAGIFTQLYGRFEARIKVPRGVGLWPSFWMLGDDLDTVGWPESGEIDIFEIIGREPNKVYGTMHGPGYSGAQGLGGSRTMSGGGAFADDFHTFAVDWSATSIIWYLDGEPYSQHVPADTGANPWAFDHPFFLLLNVAVGGNWPGSPDGSTTFPQQMLIDYVRVYAGGGQAVSGPASTTSTETTPSPVRAPPTPTKQATPTAAATTADPAPSTRSPMSPVAPLPGNNSGWRTDSGRATCTTDADGHCTMEHHLGETPSAVVVTLSEPATGQDALPYQLATDEYRPETFRLRAATDVGPYTGEITINYVAHASGLGPTAAPSPSSTGR